MLRRGSGQGAALVPANPHRAAPIVRRVLEVQLGLDRRNVGIEFLALGLRRGGQRRVNGVPQQVHGMAAHVADLSGAEVPEHVPGEAVRAGPAGKIARVVGVLGRRAEPEIEVQSLRRLTLCGQVAGAADLAVAPGIGRRQVADRAVEDQFAKAIEVLHRVPLHAHLGGQLVLLLQPVRADHAGLFHADRQGLLAVDVQIAVQGPVGDEGVGVVGRADDHGVEVFLLQALPPIDVGLGLGEPFQGVGEPLLVHVAEGHDVLVGQRIVMGQAAAPDADQRHVQLVAGGVLAGTGAAGQEEQARSRRSGGFEEFTTFHRWVSERWDGGGKGRSEKRRQALIVISRGAGCQKPAAGRREANLKSQISNPKFQTNSNRKFKGPKPWALGICRPSDLRSEI